MNVKSLPRHSDAAIGKMAFAFADELPLTVRDAAVYLGVSPQTVYLWVERKQIPHLRVMGRNIRFLKSELEPFRAHSNRRWEWQDRVNMMVSYTDARTATFGGCATGTNGCRRLESTHTEDWQEAQRKLRERLQARDNNTLHIVHKGEQIDFMNGWSFSWRTTPNRQFAQLRHTRLIRAVEHLKPTFGAMRLERSMRPDRAHLRTSASTPRSVAGAGVCRKESSSRLRCTRSSGCFVGFSACSKEEASARKSLRRDRVSGEGEGSVPAALHDMVGAAEDRVHAPAYLRNVIRIITETGFRVYKELGSMKKEQVDLENKVVWIPDSKTPNGVAEVPLTEHRTQSVPGPDGSPVRARGCFRATRNKSGHQTTFKTVWHTTFERAKVPYFRLYDLRSTYATRLSAGGVADEWVTQMLRQGDAKVFKKYSQMKLQMKRRLWRRSTGTPTRAKGFDTVEVQ